MIFAGTLFCITVLGLGCSSDEIDSKVHSAEDIWDPAGVSRPGSLSEVHHFRDLAAMIAASDAVVVGTVAAHLDDRFLVLPPEERQPSMRFLRFEVSVDEVLLGSVAESSIGIELDEGYFRAIGAPLWAQVGQSSLLFVVRKRDSLEGFYRPANSQAIFLLEDAGHLMGIKQGDRLVNEVSTWSLSDIRRRVQAAKERSQTR